MGYSGGIGFFPFPLAAVSLLCAATFAAPSAEARYESVAQPDRANYTGPSSMALSPDIFPAEGETSELFPGGPKLTRRGLELEMDLGADRTDGYMRAVYNRDNALLKTETYNGAGFKITGTDYGISKGKLTGIVETWYDLGEKGAPTRWERTEPDPASKPGAPRVIHIVEELDPRTGRRIELSRNIYSGVQNCDAAVAQVADGAVIQSVDQITSRLQGSAACPATATQGLTFDEYNVRTHPMSSVPGAPVCLDSNCNFDPAAFGTFVKDTIREGAACMAQLGMRQQTPAARQAAAAALRSIGHGASISAGNAALLRRTMALRNAASLLMVFNQSQNLGAVFDANKQMWVEPYTGAGARPDSAVMADQAHVNAQTHNTATGPMKFFCSPDGYAMVNKTGSVMSRYRTSGLALASANVPGQAGWPMVMLRGAAGGGAPRTTFNVTDKALLFHEFLHIIGYPHQEQNPEAAGLPLHTACQTCCFPQGFRGGNFVRDDACNADGPGSIRDRNCGICAGDPAYSLNAGTADQKAANRARYLNGIRGCFGNGNPL